MALDLFQLGQFLDENALCSGTDFGCDFLRSTLRRMTRLAVSSASMSPAPLKTDAPQICPASKGATPKLESVQVKWAWHFLRRTILFKNRSTDPSEPVSEFSQDAAR